MTLLRLTLANLRLAPLTNALNVSLLALGTATIVILLLLSQQLSSAISRDAEGIDLVLGAKGSPVQLVMSSVYHADIPTGNIELGEALRWAKDRRIAKAVPLSLGDSAKGFRVVGTTAEFASLYNVTTQQGEFWHEPFEAVLGAEVARTTGLSVGDQFSSAHGMAGHGDAHAQPYTVVGILQPERTVVDRLILTELSSVWAVHGGEHHGHGDEPGRDEHDGHEGDEHDDHHEDAHDEHSDHEDEQTHHDEHEAASASHSALTLKALSQPDYANKQITAMLLQYRSPVAAVSLPRQINAQSSLQAAAPAFELARLVQLLGVGFQGLKAFAAVLIGLAIFSVFAALYTAMQSRRGELAMMRCLGATRVELMACLLMEGLLLGIAGTVLGLLIGHATVELLAQWMASGRALGLTGLTLLRDELWLVPVLLLVYSLAALLPAWQAYRTDVAQSLSDNG